MLTGASDKSGKGIIDFYMYKYDLKTYLLGPLMEMHPFQSEAKEVLRTIFADHHAYRAKVRPVAETPPGGRRARLVLHGKLAEEHGTLGSIGGKIRVRVP